MKHASLTALPVLAALVALAPLGGCATSASPGFAATTPTDYARAYRIGNYAEAAQAASRAPAGDDRAKLVEGMSRVELGEEDRAEAILEPLLRSRIPEVRGKAAATLGLIELDRGNAAAAARLLQTAANTLEGSDGVWASHYAVRAIEATGAEQAPARLVERARGADRVVNRGSSDTGYTIQFGSFSTQARAMRHAQSVSRLTRPNGMADPEIKPVQRGARTLYAVRSGSFSSRNAAAQVASSLNTETAVIRLQ
jgi:hypothetical protein